MQFKGVCDPSTEVLWEVLQKRESIDVDDSNHGKDTYLLYCEYTLICKEEQKN